VENGKGDRPLFPSSSYAWKKGTVPFSERVHFCHGLLVRMSREEVTRAVRLVYAHGPDRCETIYIDTGDCGRLTHERRGQVATT
jgi:hypothetical protein